MQCRAIIWYLHIATIIVAFKHFHMLDGRPSSLYNTKSWLLLFFAYCRFFYRVLNWRFLFKAQFCFNNYKYLVDITPFCNDFNLIVHILTCASEKVENIEDDLARLSAERP